MPDWLINILGDDIIAKLEYITNGKHMMWYASFRFTIFAAIFGALVALMLGLIGAGMRNSSFLPFRWLGMGYINIVRGVPDVLFFLFFPLAFEQGVEWFISLSACTPSNIVPGVWPPCKEAQWFLGTYQYLILAAVSLGIVYGAFAANVIHGAMGSVPKGQLEAARAFGMNKRQVLFRVHIPQMWIFALPGLSNVWMLLVKATSLLSLLQIADIVLWADRLGAPNYLKQVGLVHPDWRWKYYLALFLFYILITYLSERGFAYLRKKVGRGMVGVR